MNKKILSLIIAVLLGISLCWNLTAEQDNDWKLAKGIHFIIYHKDLPDRFILQTLEYAEDYYRDITYNLGFSRDKFWLDENRAKIYIYKDSQDYVLATGMPEWSGGRAKWQEKTIETFAWSSNFFNSLLPHELAHIIFREFAGIGANIPLWLDEGVAGFQELVNRAKSKRIVKDALKNKTFIPLGELSKIDIRTMDDKEKAALFYAESLSAVEFLIKQFGTSRFYDFTQALNKGKSLDDALNDSYKEVEIRNLEDFNNRWMRFLRYYE